MCEKLRSKWFEKPSKQYTQDDLDNAYDRGYDAGHDEIENLKVIIGKLGNANYKINQKYGITPPMFKILTQHGNIINKCTKMIKHKGA